LDKKITEPAQSPKIDSPELAKSGTPVETPMDSILHFYSEIMKNLAEGIYLIRLEDGIIVYTNPRFEKMFGYEPGEMIGKDVAIVNAPTDKTPEEIKKAIMDIIIATGEWHGVVENIRKDGTRFYCYTNVSLFDHPDYGTVMISVHNDITDLIQAEDKLRQSEELFRMIVSSTPDHLLVQDHELRYVLVINVQLGLTEQDMIGKTDHDFLTKEDADKLTHIKRQVLETGNPVHADFCLSNKEGTQEFFEGSYVPKFDAADRINGLIGYLRNVTELKRTREEIDKKNAELERLNKVFVGRELRMIELKKRIKELESEIETRTDR
jgi:PAS domain S-box-containing protein